MRRLIGPTVVLAAMLQSCVSDINVDNNPTKLTIADIRKNPESYYGRKVILDGFLTIEFENYHLWENAEHEASGGCETALGIDFPDWKNYSKYNRKIATVIGVYEDFCPDFEEKLAAGIICYSAGSCGTDYIYIESIKLQR